MRQLSDFELTDKQKANKRMTGKTVNGRDFCSAQCVRERSYIS
jgi:hypothetical protein